MLIATVYEVNPFPCGEYCEELILIATVTATVIIERILRHLDQDIEPLTMHQAGAPHNEHQDYQAKEEIDQKQLTNLIGVIIRLRDHVSLKKVDK